MSRLSGLKDVLFVMIVVLAIWYPLPQRTGCQLNQSPTLQVQYPGNCC